MKKTWMGTFPFDSDEDLVIKQIRHNSAYWASDMCKRETMEKYCREKGVKDPTSIVNDLIKRGIAYTPKKGYIALTEAQDS